MYRVLIVEDDPMVASIDRSYVERTADFTVVAVCKNGEEALELFQTEEIDLVVLDYYTPGMNGDEFLDKLHETGMRPEVIMVTSANSVEIVQELLSRGISDYLVKPFEYDRFREGLERFRRRREVLQDAGTGMRQEEIDRMLSRGAAERLQDSEPLPKGMNRQTLSLWSAVSSRAPLTIRPAEDPVFSINTANSNKKNRIIRTMYRAKSGFSETEIRSLRFL